MGIGDNLMFLRALNLAGIPPNSVHWIVKKEFIQVAKSFLGDSENIIPIDDKRSLFYHFVILYKQLKHLSREKNIQIVLLDYKWKPVLFFGILCRLCKIKETYFTLPNHLLKPLAYKNIFIENYKNIHEVTRYYDLLKMTLEDNQSSQIYPLDIKNIIDKLVVNLPITIKNNLPRKYIVVIPGAAKKFKQWSVENFFAVVKSLIKENYKIVLLGGKEDSDLGKYLESFFDKSSLLNLIGATLLLDSIAIISQSTLVITNDTGLMHAADMMGVKVIALFGITNPERCGPYSQLENVLLAEHELSSKYLYGYYNELWDDSCINRITPDRVLEKVGNILSRQK